ncbi:hypothetical protein ACJRO7_025418 [Eucalyptus globulus]|uniref:MLO-like protein n=1 Tax=Eucalyptus globulus TaxID=34317 RepID=A0ABD3KL35_EUCGL
MCAVFIIVSVFIEQCIHFLAKWFKKNQKKAMMEALEKIKAELMLLGFISLVLTVSTGVLSKICIPASYGKTMLRCKFNHGNKDDDDGHDHDHDHDKGKLLSLATDMMWHRFLAASTSDDYCSKHGKISLISQSGLHQLNIFIFVPAVFHVLYSVVTMALARAKVKAESSSLEYIYTHGCFFRQLSGSVSKVDYLTMRHGFINAHLAPNSKFNFHKYIKRSMEDDFKAVVGISFPLWIFAILFLLLNVYKLYALTWLSLAPLLIILSVGTKLQVIIMEMAQDIQDRTSVVKGAPLVEPHDKLFWFNRPQWCLLLIHFTLFQNAFQMAFFLWTWSEFGWRSCFHENVGAILTGVLLGLAVGTSILVQLHHLPSLCSSHPNGVTHEEGNLRGANGRGPKDWHKEAKERSRQLKKAGLGGDGSSSSSPSSPPSTMGHKHQASNGESLPISPMFDHPSSSSDKDRLSSLRIHMDEPMGKTHQASTNAESHSIEFSFSSSPNN